MDFAFLAASALMFALIVGMAIACDRLGERK